MIHHVVFGQTPGGKKVEKLILRNKSGLKLELITYGATISSLEVPGKNGKSEDVVAGFDNLDAYLHEHPYFGCMVGRYANRIAGGQFDLDGVTYSLARNNGDNHLHGGVEGFDKKVWNIMEVNDRPYPSVLLSYLSEHLEEGYPGNLEVRHRITIGPGNQIVLDTEARTDRPTILNLTNHSYFNLSGFRKNIYDHQVMIHARTITEAGEGLIPTGKFLDVRGTPFDFTRHTPIGKNIDRIPPGYDHNFVVNRKEENEPVPVAEVYDPLSGRVLKVISTQPGVQFYTGNFLDGSLKGKGGVIYGKHSAFCLETQHFPDSPHHPHFPSTVLREGELFKHSTIFAFSVK